MVPLSEKKLDFCIFNGYTNNLENHCQSRQISAQGNKMIYIYAALRYQRQLHKICPEVPASFFSAIHLSVQKNGGREVHHGGGYLYSFDDDSVGFVFSASRVLDDVRSLLEKNRSRIREYFILVDYTVTNVSVDNLDEYLAPYAKMLIPDEGILLTHSAKEHFSAYISCIQIPKLPLYLYSGSRITEYSLPASQKKIQDMPQYTIYEPSSEDVISVFLNLLFHRTLPDLAKNLAQDEIRDFRDYSNAVHTYGLFRFSKEKPIYLINACIEYICLSFKALRKIPGRTLITIYSDESSQEFLDVLPEKIMEYCICSTEPEPVYLPVDLKNIPNDLLDLAYLIYLARQYLYTSELSDFFRYLGKQSDFLTALGHWLYSFGILSDPRNYSSLNMSIREKIENKLTERKKSLNRKFTGYLWDLYTHGLLQPDTSFLAVLTDLNFDIPDTFLVTCLYTAADITVQLNLQRNKFKNKEIVDAVEQLESAIKKFWEESYTEAVNHARDLLHFFQKGKILSGEYRTLELIAMISLKTDKRDDAAAYLEYALENTVIMHDVRNNIHTRFDIAMVYFITGNLFSAQCSLDAVEKMAIEQYAKEYEIQILFMKGRIAFELGDYKQAEHLFEKTTALASSYQFLNAKSLCQAWYGRTLAHQKRFASAENILIQHQADIPEATLFLLESALISEREISQIDFPAELNDLPEIDEVWQQHNFSWKTGFSFAEDRCTGLSKKNRTAFAMYAVFHSVYRARYLTDQDVNITVDTVAQIARDAYEKNNPYASLYYYFCYEISTDRHDRISSADSIAYLSRAFKYLQKRANEIDDNSRREQFMLDPLWNAKLYRAAKNNMLI